MKSKIIIASFLILGMGFLVSSCEPDGHSLDDKLDVSALDFSVTQNPNYDNQVYLKSNTSNAVPYWDYAVGISNKTIDTVIIPFSGTYKIEYSAFSQGGYTKSSADVTVSENDPIFFADPKWDLLTNSEQGKTWRLVAVTLGPQSDYNSVWWQPDITGNDYYLDTVTFDLNQGFNYTIDDQSGNIETGSFKLQLDLDYIPDDGIGPFDYITIGGSGLPVRDFAGDGIGGTTYRIAKLTEDELIVGQGAEFLPGNDGDWSWYTIYERVN
jgi:hypothetical protein